MPDMVKRINQIFADKVFFIPDYQRGYAWEERQWDDLLEDLELLPEGRTHFTGTLVLRARNDGNCQILDQHMNAYEAFDIIDGQQRLTTVMILLKAIHDEMGTFPEFHGLADRLRETYLYQIDRNGQPFTKLTLNTDSQDFFAGNILGLHPGIGGPTIRSHERLLGARDYFSNYLVHKRKELKTAYQKWLQELYGKVTLQLNLIVYPVDDELDAGTIFETMNDRGKPLTELEKVKNYLLYVSGKLDLPAPHELSQLINETWKIIYERLMAASLAGRINEDQLLRAHWLMAYDYEADHWENARSIKNHFSLREYIGRHPDLLQDLNQYLYTLQDAVTAYCDIFSPKNPNAFNDFEDEKLRNQIALWGSKLTRLGVSASFLPLLIAVRAKAGDDGTTYLQVLHLLEKYSFRVFSWRKARSNAGQTALFQAGNSYFLLPNNIRLFDEIARLIDYYCPDETFIERFNRETENWYQWGDINYFLYEYEHHLAGGRPVQLTWETLSAKPKPSSLEHILPQAAQADYWRKHFTTDQHKRWVHDVSNLTLTYDNSGLGNKPFPEKKGEPGIKGTYADSPLFIERELAQVPDWTISAMKERREQLVAWAQERWYMETPKISSIDAYPKEYTLARIQAVAAEYHVGEEFEKLLDVIGKYGVYPNPKKWCVILAPPDKRSRALITVWPKPGRLHIGIWHNDWLQYIGVEADQVKDILGPQKWMDLNGEQMDRFLVKLEILLQQVFQAL